MFGSKASVLANLENEDEGETSCHDTCFDLTQMCDESAATISVLFKLDEFRPTGNKFGLSQWSLIR